MKLKSFGCSFIYGSDLSDQITYKEFISEPSNSDFTWPALISKKLGLAYECYAWPGTGNFKILCDIVSQASLNDPSIFLINWTWIDRFDFVNSLERWETLRPSEDSSKSEFYYRHFHSQLKDMVTSVYNVNTAIDFLQEREIPFVMSYMDYNMVQPIDPNWHDPKYLSVMQNKIKKHLIDFQGKNFLDWSKTLGFKISKHWHPLEEAHAEAAKYMLPWVEKTLKYKYDTQ